MPDEGRRIEIQIAATGGEAAAAELRLPVQAQQELVTTSQAAAPAVDTVAGSLTAAGAAAGEAALAVGSVTEAVAATAATPVDPAMAFEFARIEERAAAAGEAVDRARRLAEKSGPLTGLQEMEFELQRITAEAQVADAALAKIESGQLALNGNMVATLRAKVRQADITAEIYGPEIEQAREAEAAIAAEAAAVAKAEELKKAAAAAAAIRHEEARARNEEKMLWRTRRRELNALTRGQGLGPLGRMPLGIDPGMLAGIVALGGAAMELQAHLKEVGGAIEEINTADLAKIDAQLAGQIDSWKELGTAISHPLDALEKWVNGISTPDAIKALNEEIKRNVDEQNAAMDAALEKGTVTAAALMKMAEELRIANHLLDSKDKTASTERDIRDEREEWAIRNSSEPEEMKERRIKELKKNRLHEDSEDEITRINRGVDEKKSGINEESESLRNRRVNTEQEAIKAQEQFAETQKQINEKQAQVKKIYDANPTDEGRGIADGATKVLRDEIKGLEDKKLSEIATAAGKVVVAVSAAEAEAKDIQERMKKVAEAEAEGEEARKQVRNKETKGDDAIDHSFESFQKREAEKNQASKIHTATEIDRENERIAKEKETEKKNQEEEAKKDRAKSIAAKEAALKSHERDTSEHILNSGRADPASRHVAEELAHGADSEKLLKLLHEVNDAAHGGGKRGHRINAQVQEYLLSALRAFNVDAKEIDTEKGEQHAAKYAPESSGAQVSSLLDRARKAADKTAAPNQSSQIHDELEQVARILEHMIANHDTDKVDKSAVKKRLDTIEQQISNMRR